MPDVKIQVVGGAELRRVMNDPNLVRGPLQVFLRKAAFVAESNMKQEAPVDTGRLRSSIMTQIEPLRAAVGPTVTYAPYVEYGTRPHWPPKGALQPWAGRHGFPAGAKGDWLVRFIIFKRGTKPHPYVRPAAKKSEPEIKMLFKQLIADIRARWNGHAI